jgi:uncharacterized protein (TIGR02001 family)
MKNVMSRLGGAFAVVATGIAVAMPAAAQDKPLIPGTLSANVGLTSEYFFRGISQTDDAPAIQGGLDYEVEIASPVSLYLGVWGSNVDFSEGGSVDGATVEIDWYGGVRGGLANTGVTWDVGFIYYSYPGAASSLDYDFWEIQGALGYDFGVASVTASVNYSPENFGNSGDAWYPALAVDVPVPGIDGLSLSGHVGKQYIDDEATFGVPDYVTWGLSVTYAIPGLVDVSLSYSDTDISPSGDGTEEAVFLTVSKSF